MLVSPFQASGGVVVDKSFIWSRMWLRLFDGKPYRAQSVCPLLPREPSSVNGPLDLRALDGILEGRTRRREERPSRDDRQQPKNPITRGALRQDLRH